MGEFSHRMNMQRWTSEAASRRREKGPGCAGTGLEVRQVRCDEAAWSGSRAARRFCRRDDARSRGLTSLAGRAMSSTSPVLLSLRLSHPRHPSPAEISLFYHKTPRMNASMPSTPVNRRISRRGTNPWTRGQPYYHPAPPLRRESPVVDE